MSEEHPISDRRRQGTITTLPYWDEPTWTAAVTILDRRRYTKLGRVVRLFRAAHRYGTVVLDGASRWDQFAAVAIARMKSPPRTLITDCTWKRGSNALDRIACQLGIRAMDGPHLTYGVLSSDEAARFGTTWGVEPARVVYTPFCATLGAEERLQPTVDGDFVFSGGNSMRDYEPLIAAARQLPDRFRIATRLLDGRDDLPGNVEAGVLSHTDFMAAMREAAVVVVPLPRDLERSAGQQTYLNAMALGKLVVVSDSPGVRDYIADGVTGLIVPPGDVDAMAAAILWGRDPSNRNVVDAMVERAKQEVRARFTRTHYVEHLLAAVDGNRAGVHLREATSDG